jgi:hypothetical protein
MCLYTRSDQSQNKKDLNKWFGNRKKFAYVYKILVKIPGEDFYRSEYFSNFIWNFSKQKVYRINRSSNPTKEELSYGERWTGMSFGRIDKGFHVYTNLETAKAIYSHYRRKIAKFKVFKEDVVAVNNNWFFSNRCLKEAVCRKLTFVKIIED